MYNLYKKKQILAIFLDGADFQMNFIYVMDSNLRYRLLPTLSCNNHCASIVISHRPNKPCARRALRIDAACLHVLVMIVGEDPIEQNEQEGVFLCGGVTKPGRQEDGIILRHERLGVGVRRELQEEG